MPDAALDDLDKAILHFLQVDARNNTNKEIGEQVDVAASTVGTRIGNMEEEGIINGYHPAIDYERAGLPLHTQFVCTAPVAKRKELADQALNVYGVVDVRESIAGEENIHIETVSQDLEEIEEVTQELDDLGLTLHRSEILQRHHTRPFDHFGSDMAKE